MYTMKFGKRRFGEVQKPAGEDYTIWIIVGVILFVLILGGCYCYSNDIQPFGNVFQKSPQAEKMKNLDILYFFSPTCPWSKKATELFQKEGVKGSLQMVDVTTEEGKKMAVEYGAASKGIPAFISRKNKTGTVGYRESLQEILDALERKVEEESPEEDLSVEQIRQKISDLGIVLFHSPSCGWCTKLKKELEEKNAINLVELVDITNPAGKSKLEQIVQEFQGVPVTYSTKTKKHVTGYRPVSRMIAELS